MVGGEEGWQETAQEQRACRLEAQADVIVSSPPYADEITGKHGETETAADSRAKRRTQGGRPGLFSHEYGDSEGQIGNSSGETFWTAAKQIVSQVAAILKPGGVAVWVCKNFVRKGVIVEFSDDWRKLNEACGLELVEWIKASLVKEDRAPDLFGGESVKTTERKSFFRRLADKKGSPRIDHEDVLVLRK